MCTDNAGAMKARQAKESLYSRLGKEKKIGVFVDNLYESHKGNDQIGHMFKHVDRDRFVDNVVKFLVAGTGGANKYKGRNMKDVHSGMDITSSDFLAAGGDVQAVMKELKYGENEIQEVVCALVSFVPVVVTK
ncbi:MAG: group 1 truncated hemoglobin [Bacteriovoracaceae bacterium]|nr:group 1 truncated hemoglobin [Bacteriovoracaceae bacterium]